MHFFNVGKSFSARLGPVTVAGDLTRRTQGIQPWVVVGFCRHQIVKFGGAFRNPWLEV